MARLIPLLALLLVASVAAGPAGAITNGAVDTTHDYAGAVVVDGSVACSGVLAAPTVFLTAKHCVPATGARVAVSLDHSLDRSTWTLHAGTATAHATDDVAAIVLDHAVDVTPALLPAAGAAGAATEVVAVGYGYNDRSGNVFSYDGLRRSASTGVKKVEAAVLVVESKNGGVCFGDSGGPGLVGDTVLTLTSMGRKSCNGSAELYRLDTPSARSFLAQFVSLP